MCTWSKLVDAANYFCKNDGDHWDPSDQRGQMDGDKGSNNGGLNDAMDVIVDEASSIHDRKYKVWQRGGQQILIIVNNDIYVFG